MPTSHWHQHYCCPSMYVCRKHRMHSQNFHSQLICPPFLRGSRLNKIHPRGNPAIIRSIPAVFPQYSYPHPRKTRGFRGIPAVPIPVHTSTVHTVQMRRSVCTADSTVQGGPKSCTFSTHSIFETVQDKMKRIRQMFPQFLGIKIRLQLLCSC